MTEEKKTEGKENYIEYKDTYMVIAKSIDGDFYVLDIESNNGENCSVLRMTHEGYTPISEWSGIPEFVYDMLVQRAD